MWELLRRKSWTWRILQVWPVHASQRLMGDMHTAMLGVPASTTVAWARRPPPLDEYLPASPSVPANPTSTSHATHRRRAVPYVVIHVAETEELIGTAAVSRLLLKRPPYLRPLPCATAWLPIVPHRVASTSRLPDRSPTPTVTATPISVSTRVAVPSLRSRQLSSGFPSTDLRRPRINTTTHHPMHLSQ